MKKITVVFIFLVALNGLPVFAEKIAMPPVVMPTAASNGFGGSHVAYTDNVFALLVNPAAMTRVEQRSFFALAPSLFSPQTVRAFGNSVIKLTNGDTSAFGDILDNINKRDGKIGLGFELREFPLSVAWVADGFGFGLWNRVFVNINLIDSDIDANIYGDVMLPVGFAFKLLNLENHSLDAGITVKPFIRLWIRESESITSIIAGGDILDDISVPVMAGGTFDAGLLYRWQHGLRFGLTFNDIYSRTTVLSDIRGNDNNSYYIPFTMNMGLAYDLKAAFLGLTLAADWRDMENFFHRGDYTRKNSQLDFGAGLQVSLLDIVYARVGLNEMLPSCGLGLSLGPCEIDMAYYGREFGLEPGQLSTAIFEVVVSIRPKAKERDWPWMRRSVVGLFTGGE